jgi:hypothetical protein
VWQEEKQRRAAVGTSSTQASEAAVGQAQAAVAALRQQLLDVEAAAATAEVGIGDSCAALCRFVRDESFRASVFELQSYSELLNFRASKLWSFRASEV